MRTKILVLAASMFVVTSAASAAQPARTDRCAKDWNKVRRMHSVTNKLTYWRSVAAHCTGDGQYYARLANLYMLKKQYPQAQHVLDTALRAHISHQNKVLNTLGELAWAQHHIHRAREIFLKVTREYPAWYGGYQALGALDMSLHRYRNAVFYLNAANHRKPHGLAYGFLAEAYHDLGQDGKAIAAMGRAYVLMPSVASQPDIVLAVAGSFARLKRYRHARRILQILKTKDSEAASDPRYAKLMARVNQRLKSATKSGGAAVH